MNTALLSPMLKFKYERDLKNAVRLFWLTRSHQLKNQSSRNVRDQGTRGAVTGGRQLDGFLELLKKISIDAGVPAECIYTKDGEIPGYFRPTKEWDLIIISPKKNLIACFELKSQVGSFGNNFNNRTEEAIGSAVDVWTAFREGAFLKGAAPWPGYTIIVEKSAASTSPVRVSEPHFEVLEEFVNTSYLDRYKILLRKLILERLYTHAALIWTSSTKSRNVSYGYMDDELSFDSFVNAYAGYLLGRMNEFKEHKE